MDVKHSFEMSATTKEEYDVNALDTAFKSFGITEKPEEPSIAVAMEKENPIDEIPKTGNFKKVKRIDTIVKSKHNKTKDGLAAVDGDLPDEPEAADADTKETFEYKKYAKNTKKDKKNVRHVTFNTTVDVYYFSDVWAYKMMSMKLKTEEEQQARRKYRRNF